MRFLVQRPFLEEFSSSALTRSAQDAGIPLSTLTHALVGDRKPLGLYGWPHLTVIGRCVQMPLEELLDKHTIFPFVTSLLSDEERSQHRSGVLAEKVGHLGDARGANHGFARPRWCEECTRADRARLGFSYWRITHNLPGVLVCLEHHLPLLANERARVSQGRVADWELPDQIPYSDPIVSEARPFLVRLAQAAVRRFREPVSEFTARGLDWMRTRFESLGMRTEGKIRFNAELLAMIRSCLGVDASAVFTRDVESEIATVAKLPWHPGTTRWAPLKHLVLQAALDMPDKVLAEHIPTDLVSRRRLRDGAVASDAEKADVARNFIDARMTAGVTTTVREVLEKCGVFSVVGPEDKRYPLLRLQLNRLIDSNISTNAPIGLTDKELVQVARQFLREREELCQSTTAKEMLAHCGLNHFPSKKAYPLLCEQIRQLRESSIAAVPIFEGTDDEFAQAAAAFIDSRIKSGTRTLVSEVVQASGFGRLVVTKNFPLLRAQMDRLKTLSIAANRNSTFADAEAALAASEFIANARARGDRISVDGVIRTCGATLKIGRGRRGYPKFFEELDKIHEGRGVH